MTLTTDPPSGTPGGRSPGTTKPGYRDYAAPTGLGDDAGEPSIGVDWKTDAANGGTVMYQAGLETLAVTLDSSGNRVATVVLTATESDTDYAQVVRLGARGLVMKGDGPQRLFEAIRLVASGELAFSDELAHQVVSSLANDTRATHGTPQPSLHRLSERERQIAYSVARGMKNRDIANQLSISENTVKRHLQSIFGKTGARDRLELAVLALNEASKAA